MKLSHRAEGALFGYGYIDGEWDTTARGPIMMFAYLGLCPITELRKRHVAVNEQRKLEQSHCHLLFTIIQIALALYSFFLLNIFPFLQRCLCCVNVDRFLQ